MERFNFIFLVAGLGFFVFAFIVSAILPMLPMVDLEVQTIEDLAAEPPLEFVELKEQYPKAYRKAFYTKSDEQVLTELSEKYPDTFTEIFSKTDQQAIEQLQQSYSEIYDYYFEDMDIDEAMDEFDYARDEIVEELADSNADVYAELFEVSVGSAIAMLNADYPLVLLKIQQANPAAYDELFEERTIEDVFAEALVDGKGTYVAEACWHCHSQFVRPWGRDEERYGRVSFPEEYQNELNYPPLWGTRRIGPDMIRRGGKQSNDWHVAHFANPRNTSPVSIMPNYKWFFEDDGKTPNKTGLSMIAYVQWLGSWLETRDENVYQIGDIDRSYPEPVIDNGVNEAGN